MSDKHSVIILHITHFKGIYPVLPQIWKRRKSRSSGANSLAKNAAGATIFAFLASQDALEVM